MSEESGERELPVLVEWEDADHTSGWHNVEDVATTASIVSLGFLTRDIEEESFIVLTQSLNENPIQGKFRTSRLGESLAIPRSAVRNIYILTAKVETDG